MSSSIFQFILRYSKREQLWIVLVTALSLPFLYVSLELPKTIVNKAICGDNSSCSFPVDVFGFQLGQVPYLMALSAAFLLLVLINGGFKYYINRYKGQMGERMLRRLRFELYARILRFPLSRFRKVSPGEIIPMVTSEVEPLGGFIGDAFAQPIQQGGTLLVYCGFILIQDPVLGMFAMALYPFQGWLIPRLQRKVNALGKQRVRAMRGVADRIGESIAGIGEIHAHDTSRFHMADIADRFGTVFDIRFEIYNRKFFIKFLNNTINQLTPFFFYAVGGYLVIQGSLSFGALVAVLAAYKDMAAPWKELLDYYQQSQDMKIKYEQVIEQFQGDDLLDPALQETDPGDRRLTGTLALAGIGYGEADGARALEGISFDLDLSATTAIFAADGGGRDELMMMIARLIEPSTGRIRLGDADWATLPETLLGRRLAYVGPNAYIFNASLRENLLYGLRHRPLAMPTREAAAEARRARRVHEARASGNVDYDIAADWVDYAAAGVPDAEALRQRVIEVCTLVGLGQDIYAFGLFGTIDPKRHRAIAERIIEARRVVSRRLAEDRSLGSLVELFDRDRYNTNASVAENLLFGTPTNGLTMDGFVEHPYLRQTLERAELTDTFVEIGYRVAETMVEIFADLPPGHEFFEQFSFVSSEELPGYQQLLTRVAKDGIGGLRQEDRNRLLSLTLRQVPARHRLGLIDEKLQSRILETRHIFGDNLPGDLRTSIAFFDPEAYNAAATLQDNILFGKVAYGAAQAGRRVAELVSEVVRQLDLRETVMEVGLDYAVGIAGGRLSVAQRQKAALARALIKRPDVLLLNDCISALDGGAQAKVMAAVVENRGEGQGVVWGIARPELARLFDHVIVLRGGQIVERGEVGDLSAPGHELHSLLKTG